MGAEPEVPPKAVSPVPVPCSAESEAPGAPISGLMALKLKLGPREEEETFICAICFPPSVSNLDSQLWHADYREANRLEILHPEHGCLRVKRFKVHGAALVPARGIIMQRRIEQRRGGVLPAVGRPGE